MIFPRAFTVWLLLIALETVHGILRNRFLAPAVGDFRARQIGVFIASAIIFALTVLTIRWIGAVSTASLFTIGFFWMILTLAFEFSLGRALGASWERLLSDYDLPRGGLMPLGLVVLVLAPWGARRVRKR